jgi:hypothetical protein
VIERIRPKSRRHDVGYRRPPKETQFKPGTSGNPKGRPTGTRSPGAILRAIVEQKVSVTESGKTRRISALEVTFRRLTTDAMRGDQKAIRLLLSLVERYGDAPGAMRQLEDLLVEDRDILAHYLPEPTSLSRTSGPELDEEER